MRPLWERSGWLEQQLSLQRGELERVRSSIRFRLGSTLLELRRRPWRAASAIATLWGTLRGAPATRAPEDEQEWTRRGPLQWAEGCEEAVDELRAELYRVMDESEALYRGDAYVLGSTLVAARGGLNEVRRVRHYGDGSVLGTPRPRVELPRASAREWPVAVVGPAWLEEIFAADDVTGAEAVRRARLVVACADGSLGSAVQDALDSARARGAKTARWQLEDLPPTIQPRLHNPVGWWQEGHGPVGVHERAAPPAWQEAFAQARGMGGGDGWRERRSRFARMREIHGTSSTRQRLASICADAGLSFPAEERISLALATNRPTRLEPAVRAMLEQTCAAELCVVTHGSGFDMGPVREACAEVGVELRADSAPEQAGIGEVRQRSFALCTGTWIAKFDDDDLYGPRYAEDMVWQARATDAAVISKLTTPILTTEDGKLYQRRRAPELCYTLGTYAGLNLLRRELVVAIGLRPVRRGEDAAYLRDAMHYGLPIFAGDPYHWVYKRNRPTSHNWNANTAQILRMMDAREMTEMTVEDFFP